MGLAGRPKQSSGHRWLCGYTSGPRKHSWQQRFSSEDAAAADGQLPFACAATRGGSGKGSVDLPFWHCATTIVLHLKRTGGINGFSKAASQVIIGIEIPKPCCPVSSLTLFASNKKRLLYFTVLEANNFFLQKYLTKIDQTTISS